MVSINLNQFESIVSRNHKHKNTNEFPLWISDMVPYKVDQLEIAMYNCELKYQRQGLFRC